MDERLRVGQFSIQAGNWQRHPTNISIIDASANKARRTRGDLFILIEVPQSGSMPPVLYEELMQAMVETYYTTTGSITRGLRAALLAANTIVFEANLRAENEQRLTVGLDCAVIRDDDIYVGQLGPALATLVHQSELTRFPSDSVWLRSEGPSAFDLIREPPAGSRRDVEPNLYHATFYPNDVFILSTTSLIRIASAADLVSAVTYTGSESARGNIEALANGRDVSAIVIEYRRDTPAPEPSGFTRPEVKEGSAPVSVTHESGESSSPPGKLPAGTSVPMASVAQEEHTPAEQQPTPRRAAPARTEFDNVRSGLSESAEKVRQGAEDLLLRVLPEAPAEEPPDRAQRGAGLSLSGGALVAVALVIPLVVLVIMVMTRVQYERARNDQFNALRVLAQTRYDTAMRMQDRAYMRQGLHEALATTEEGMAINPSDTTFVDLRRRIQQKLDEIDSVERLFHFWQLADVGEDAISPTDSSRIVIEGVNVYVLNRGSDRVYRYMLNDIGDAFQPLETGPVLLQKGDMRGGIRFGDLADIAWLEAGGQRTASSFVVLERAGSLLVYDRQRGIDVLPMANSDTWLKPQAVACYFGNLYVLDPLLNRILKYVPGDNAYTTPPGDYLNQPGSVDLTGAVDMAVDGNLYVLFADGRVAKFLKGDPQPFSLAGLPSPMRSPTSIFVSGPKKVDGVGYIYVADTGNERVLQFDKNGNYIRQFQTRLGETQMRKLRGIYVDEERKRMFVLSGRTLWLSDIPQVGAPKQSGN
jgi:hypothetical protein